MGLEVGPRSPINKHTLFERAKSTYIPAVWAMYEYTPSNLILYILHPLWFVKKCRRTKLTEKMKNPLTKTMKSPICSHLLPWFFFFLEFNQFISCTKNWILTVEIVEFDEYYTSIQKFKPIGKRKSRGRIEFIMKYNFKLYFRRH